MCCFNYYFMTCRNCALLMDKIARLEKVYVRNPNQKTAALAVLECEKLKREKKKLSEKVSNISSKCIEIKKTLNQREAYIKVLLKQLNEEYAFKKNGGYKKKIEDMEKKINNQICAYNALNDGYKQQIKKDEEKYYDMDERWRRYCNQLITANENIKKQLEDREAENERLFRIVQKYKIKERDFVLENKGFKEKDVWKMNDVEKNVKNDRSSVSSELSSFTGIKDLSSTNFLINRIDDEKNPFIVINNSQLGKSNIVNNNDIQNINNDNNELRDVSSSRSDIYKKDSL